MGAKHALLERVSAEEPATTQEEQNDARSPYSGSVQLIGWRRVLKEHRAARQRHRNTEP